MNAPAVDTVLTNEAIGFSTEPFTVTLDALESDDEGNLRTTTPHLPKKHWRNREATRTRQ